MLQLTRKQTIFSIIAFFSALFLTLIVTFPVSAIASKIVAGIIEENKIDVRYDDINITLFGAKATNLQTGPLTVKSIQLDYNPIGLLFKRISFQAQSPVFNINGKLSGNNLNADIKASVAGIAQIMEMSGSGSVDCQIEYNIKEEVGSINLSSANKVTFNHPMLPVDVSSLQGQANIENNKLTIAKLSADGDNSLDIKGSIDINKKKISSSVLSINGEASMGNYPLKFTLSGQARAPKFSIK